MWRSVAVRASSAPSFLAWWSGGLQGPCPVGSLVQAFQHAAHTLRQCQPACRPAAIAAACRFSLQDINALEQHLTNLLTPATPYFFNTLYDPFREGADFVRGYPFSLREGVPTAISHGLWLNIPDYDAPTQVWLDVLPGVLCSWHDRSHRPCLNSSCIGGQQCAPAGLQGQTFWHVSCALWALRPPESVSAVATPVTLGRDVP